MMYMAMSLDGFIAGPNNETPWSDAEWDNYHDYIQRHDVLIVGRKTHELMCDYDEYARLGDPNIIVVTTQNTIIDDVVTASSPYDALSQAQKRGYQTALIGGGTQLNSAFWDGGLIDSLHVDIESVVMRNGTSLLTSGASQTLTLTDSKILSSGTISADYTLT